VYVRVMKCHQLIRMIYWFPSSTSLNFTIMTRLMSVCLLFVFPTFKMLVCVCGRERDKKLLL